MLDDDFALSLRFQRQWRGGEIEISLEARKLLAEIEYRIKRSHRLSLVQLGFRGDDLVEMHEKLFGRKPRRTKPRTGPIVLPDGTLID
jgi:hypothetical protein